MAATAKFSYLSSLPAGFVFRPTVEQLITHYLKKKNDGNECVVSFIKEIDLYKFEPEQLPDKSFIPSDNFEWFFFRANTLVIERTTGTGSWKSSGDPRPIKARGTDEVIGSREIFVFHRGRGDKGVKTNWVIREYRLHPDTKIPSQHPFLIFKLKDKNADGEKKITPKPGAGTSKNPDNAIQSVYDFEKHITESVFGKHKNLDQMTSNKHEESEESDDAYADNQIRKLRRDPISVKLLTVSGNTKPRKVVSEGSKQQKGPLSEETPTTETSQYKTQGDNAHTQIVNPPHSSTKRIHHNSSQHPLVCFAKALLGIVMLVMFARDMVLYRHRR
ncbi:NAC domain-containing protein 40-like [Cucurbita moschata]|uniref:NAC domain-containing protein 40-like n=1 Tax=Cucurbita moschata TaxID=3662 RepID=A0A6J1FE82_CUCMO|nr:NAC domain-containing protein 40-like [Cucurbita moschata]